MSDRFRAAVAVYGLVAVDGRLLLMRRAGSGYRDGQLGLPAGHLEGAEDAVRGLVRELREELGIDADPVSCRLATVAHRRPESADDDEYLDLFFTVGSWTGVPAIAEPDKCTELVWADPDDLPPDVVDYVAAALRGVRRRQPLVLVGWA